MINLESAATVRLRRRFLLTAAAFFFAAHGLPLVGTADAQFFNPGASVNPVNPVNPAPLQPPAATNPTRGKLKLEHPSSFGRQPRRHDGALGRQPRQQGRQAQPHVAPPAPRQNENFFGGPDLFNSF